MCIYNIRTLHNNYVCVFIPQYIFDKFQVTLGYTNYILSQVTKFYYGNTKLFTTHTQSVDIMCIPNCHCCLGKTGPVTHTRPV